MEVNRERNTAGRVCFPVISQASRPDYKTTPTFAVGDWKLYRYTGGVWTENNTTNLPTETVLASGVCELIYTAAEVNPADDKHPVIIKGHDVAGAEWDDQMIVIWLGGVKSSDLGAGATSFPYTVTDSVTLLPIAGVAVWVSTDAAGLNVVASGVTNALGVVTFMLDAGSYYFWKQIAGYADDQSTGDLEVVP